MLKLTQVNILVATLLYKLLSVGRSVRAVYPDCIRSTQIFILFFFSCFIFSAFLKLFLVPIKNDVLQYKLPTVARYTD